MGDRESGRLYLGEPGGATTFTSGGYGQEHRAARDSRLAMVSRERETLQCATLRREREDRPVDPARYVCQCDHDHPAGVVWCDLCEYPVE